MNGILFRAGAPSYNLQGNPITFSGAVQNQSGLDQAIGVNMTLQGGSHTFDDGGKTLTVSGALSGFGGLLKSGSGTLVLSPGAPGNTYQGVTQVASGRLVVTAPYALPDGTNLTVGNASYFSAPVVPSSAEPVPEPGTIALLAIGGCATAIYRTFRRRGARFRA
jgi:autotransporter-associated beta strand protein